MNDVSNVVEPQNTEVDPQKEVVKDSQTESFSREYVETLRKENAEARIRLKKIEVEQEQEKTKILQEQGKFKELYETHLNELNSLKVEHEQIKAKAAAYDEWQLTEKKRLLAQLPKDISKDFEDLELSKLTKIVEKFNIKDSILANENNNQKQNGKMTLEESILKQLGV
jgi:hypothetical protein